MDDTRSNATARDPVRNGKRFDYGCFEIFVFFVFLFSYIRKKIVGRKIKKARGKFKRKYLIVKVVVKLLSLSFNKF